MFLNVAKMIRMTAKKELTTCAIDLSKGFTVQNMLNSQMPIATAKMTKIMVQIKLKVFGFIIVGIGFVIANNGIFTGLCKSTE